MVLASSTGRRLFVVSTYYLRLLSTSCAALPQSKHSSSSNTISQQQQQQQQRRQSSFLNLASAENRSIMTEPTNVNANVKNKPLFWNREIKEDYLTTTTDVPIVRTAKIISLSNVDDPANASLDNNNNNLPEGAEVLQVGTCFADFDIPALMLAGVNTIFVSYIGSREPLAQLLQSPLGPSIQWIHTRSAGIDFVSSETLSEWNTNGATTNIMTNAKGQFSSTLAEYAMGACSYFCKDFERLKRNQRDRNWDRYSVLELRGATLGVVGYGDIGRATARLAKAYGMKVMALRRRKMHITTAAQVEADPWVDEMVDPSQLNRVFAESDYILCALPLTAASRNMIGAEQFDVAKEGSVFINVGRGECVDEDALIAALQKTNGPGGQRRRLKGAALDVLAVEPLPEASPLWDMLDNVLLSPHNMDMTETFMQESTEFFVNVQLPRFVRGLPLYNEVDPAAGY